MDIHTVSLIFQIVTGIVLALAGILTYFIQRSRYLKEIEPDLDLVWPDKIRIGELNPSLKKFGYFYIDIKILNRASNHAYNLSYTVNLTIRPQRDRSAAYKSKHYEFLPFSPKELLAGREVTIPVYIGINSIKFDNDLKNHFYDWLQSLPAEFNIEDAGFMAEITFEYFTKRDAVLLLLNPFHGNRAKYSRTIYRRWGFDKTLSVSQPYISKNWTIPNIELDE